MAARKPDGGYSVVARESQPRVETDAGVMTDNETVASFRGVKLHSAVIITIISSLASVGGTYMVTHQAPSDCASKGELHAVDTKVDALSDKLNQLGPAIAKNADFAHNELNELRSTTIRNSDHEAAELARLSDKLDVFMRR